MDPQLQSAVLKDDLAALNRALDEGADPTLAGANGYNVLFVAVTYMFAAIFSRGTRLPADVIPKIVEYWAHLGFYQYRVPRAGSSK